MVNEEIFPLDSSVYIDHTLFSRLKDGRIAISKDKSQEVIINAEANEEVRLITITEEEGYFEKSEGNKVQFWRIEDKVFPLCSSMYVTLPSGAKFVSCHYDSISRECFVIYKSTYRFGEYSIDSFGAISIDSKKSRPIISWRERYAEIYYENGVFYAQRFEDEKKKYYAFSKEGECIATYDTNFKMLNHSTVLIKLDAIYIKGRKYEVPETILNASVVSVPVEYKDKSKKNEAEDVLIRIETSAGIYYYTSEMEYLLGPISKDRFNIISIQKEIRLSEKSTIERPAIWCVYSINANDEITEVYLIKKEDGKYSCDTITSENGIKVYSIYDDKSCRDGKSFSSKGIPFEIANVDSKTIFFATDDKLFMCSVIRRDRIGYPYNLSYRINIKRILVDNASTKEYVFSLTRKQSCDQIVAVGYNQDGIPSYCAKYSYNVSLIRDKTISEPSEYALSLIGEGHKTSFGEQEYIFKGKSLSDEPKEMVFIISESGNIRGSAFGSSCIAGRIDGNNAYLVKDKVDDQGVIEVINSKSVHREEYEW